MWRPRPSSPGALSAAAFVLVAALAGCREQGSYYRCSCSFLTDYDDPAKVSIAVCSPSREQASSIGRGCAQSGAPAPVQGCACDLDTPRAGVTCRSGDCEILSD